MAVHPEFKWDYDDPLARVMRPKGVESRWSGETRHSHLALQHYYELGSHRSMEKLHARYLKEAEQGQYPPTQSLCTLKSWCMYYQWRLRVTRRAELDQQMFADMLAEARVEALVNDWDLGGQLRGLAQKILDAAPAFTRKQKRVVDPGEPTVVTDDGTVIREGKPREVVITVAMNSSDLAKIAKLASDLQRTAAGLDGKGPTSAVINVDYGSLTDQQLERIAAGENALDVIANR